MFRLMADFNIFPNQSVQSLHTNTGQIHSHHNLTTNHAQHSHHHHHHQLNQNHLHQSNHMTHQFQPINNHNLINTHQNYNNTNNYQTLNYQQYDQNDPYSNKKNYIQQQQQQQQIQQQQQKNPNRNKKVKDLILDLRLQQQQQQYQQQQQQVQQCEQFQYYYEPDLPAQPQNSITLNCLNNNNNSQTTSNQNSIDLIQLLNSTNTTIDDSNQYQTPLNQYHLASEDDISSLSSNSSSLSSSQQHYLTQQQQQQQTVHHHLNQHLNDIDCNVVVNLCETNPTQEEDNFLYNILNKINTQNDKLVLMTQEYETPSSTSPSSASSSSSSSSSTQSNNSINDEKMTIFNVQMNEENPTTSTTYATLQPANNTTNNTEIAKSENYIQQENILENIDQFIGQQQQQQQETEQKDGEITIDCSSQTKIQSIPSPTNSQMEEINTKELAHKISSELKRYSIPQAVFAQRVLCRSQGTLSDLLRNPKPWSKLKSGRETFRRMYKWLQEPESQRMNSLRQAAAVKRKDEDDEECDEECTEEEEEDDDEDEEEEEEEEESVRQNKLMQINQIIIDHQIQHQNNCNNNPQQQQQQISMSLNQSGHQAKKPRLVFTDIQRRTLQAIFKETKRPSKEMQVTIAQQLGLEVATVSNFFMNARRRSMDKWKDQDDENSNCSSQK